MELLLQLCDAAEGGSLAEAGGEAAECGEAACMIEFASEAGVGVGEASGASAEGAE